MRAATRWRTRVGALRGGLIAVLGGALAALALAACGSSGAGGSPGTGGSGATGGPLVAFSHCMRAHGMAHFPDPSPTGGLMIPNGMNPSAPAFQKAQAACARYMPGGGPGRQHPDEQTKLQMLGIARCMRAHGITGFPDPTLSPPSNPGAFGLAIGRGGVFLAVPRTIDVRSPAFQQAAHTCGFGPPPGAKTRAVGG
jgi:hypothetical protein